MSTSKNVNLTQPSAAQKRYKWCTYVCFTSKVNKKNYYLTNSRKLCQNELRTNENRTFPIRLSFKKAVLSHRCNAVKTIEKF